MCKDGIRSFEFELVSWVDLLDLLRAVSLGYWFPSPLLHRCFSNLCFIEKPLQQGPHFHRYHLYRWHEVFPQMKRKVSQDNLQTLVPSLARVLSTCLYNGRSHVKSGNKTHFDWISKVSIASEPWPLIAAVLRHPHPPCGSCQTAKVLLNV